MVTKRLFALCFALALVLPITYSLTAAIGNARALVRVNASPEEPAVLERTILVQNRNEIGVKASLNIDKRFEKFVNILDKELILEPDESKQARYIVTIDRGGRFEIKINVAFEPADPTVKENKVGMAATLIINSEGPIIEEPEEELEEGIENPFSQTETPEFNEEESEDKEVENKESENKAEEIEYKKESPPLGLGILIVIIIIGVGVGGFFIIQKLR